MKFTVNKIREEFLKYFDEKKDHLRQPSYSLVPRDDNSVLFINAGMTPLKKYFTREKIPPKNRITTCQRCIRTTDLDSVGKTPFHLTFFEMLGNFSFGDYFKKEAIEYAWEFLTKEIELDKNRLYITVFKDDKETYDIWINDIKIPKNHIRKGDKNNNFWKHGVGPCGPCTEIYYDRGEKYGEGEGFSVDSKLRYVEIWNIVFSEYENTNTGELIPLKNKNIDTGMGLERLAMVIQDVPSVFEIDSMNNIKEKIKNEYKGDFNVNDKSLNIIIDHVRAVLFLLNDGVYPSNIGRGFIVKKIFTRIFDQMVHCCENNEDNEGNIKIFGRFFWLVIKKIVFIYEKGTFNVDIFYILRKECFRFLRLYFRSHSKWEKVLNKLILESKKNNKNMVSGKEVFHLYETYGLSFDLIKKRLLEEGLKVNEKEFYIEKKNSIDSSYNEKYQNIFNKENYKEICNGLKKTSFSYVKDDISTKVLCIIKFENNIPIKVNNTNDFKKGERFGIIVEETCIYPTSGGQKSDNGCIYTINNYRRNRRYYIEEAKQISNNVILHICTLNENSKEGYISIGDKIGVEHDTYRRRSLSCNHTCTHILYKILRNEYGDDIKQQGSNIDQNEFRFDFNINEKLDDYLKRNGKNKFINKIENEINETIKYLGDKEVTDYIKNKEEAIKEGAIYLPNEIYDDEVRVVCIPMFEKNGGNDLSLCCGTHVKALSEIRGFKIKAVKHISRYVMRIVATTDIEDYYKNENDKLKEENSKLKEELEEKNKEIKKLKLKVPILSKGEKISDINGITVVITSINDDRLLQKLDEYRSKYKDLFAVIIFDNKIILFSSKPSIDCNYIFKNIIIKNKYGKGGGTARMAQGVISGNKDSLVKDIEEYINGVK